MAASSLHRPEYGTTVPSKSQPLVCGDPAAVGEDDDTNVDETPKRFVIRNVDVRFLRYLKTSQILA